MKGDGQETSQKQIKLGIKKHKGRKAVTIVDNRTEMSTAPVLCMWLTVTAADVGVFQCVKASLRAETI